MEAEPSTDEAELPAAEADTAHSTEITLGKGDNAVNLRCVLPAGVTWNKMKHCEWYVNLIHSLTIFFKYMYFIFTRCKAKVEN